MRDNACVILTTERMANVSRVMEAQTDRAQ
jgi:hypothetical protein